MNKKGQEMSVATLVLIVIGIVVLVMLILGFSMGWKNLWGKINTFVGGSGVAEAIQLCERACDNEQKYTYCEEIIKIKVNGETKDMTCKLIALDKQFGYAGCTEKMKCGVSAVPGGIAIP